MSAASPTPAEKGQEAQAAGTTCSEFGDILAQLKQAATNAGISVGFIVNLTKAVDMCLEKLQDEEVARQHHAAPAGGWGNLSELEDWEVLRSLLCCARDQARIAESLFDQVSDAQNAILKEVAKCSA
ncbi:MAG TPA: hypothetical protein VF503_09200 [Sphingobium sp.]|uniref:hypothetical protein n=1 Tax=Sphingobium sp. TaxID=1912891 RepID=UPI002ED1F9E8